MMREENIKQLTKIIRDISDQKRWIRKKKKVKFEKKKLLSKIVELYKEKKMEKFMGGEK